MKVYDLLTMEYIDDTHRLALYGFFNDILKDLAVHLVECEGDDIEITCTWWHGEIKREYQKYADLWAIICALSKHIISIKDIFTLTVSDGTTCLAEVKNNQQYITYHSAWGGEKKYQKTDSTMKNFLKTV